MTLQYQLYFSFRSPYSYLVMPRLMQLERAFDVCCEVHPVYPLAIRTPEFFEGRHPLWFSYFARDIHREAEFVGMPFRWANPDPVVMNPFTREISAEQPHIRRLTRLGVAAAQQGKGLAFLERVSHLIWSGTVDNWHEGEHLQHAAQAAGVDWPALTHAADQDADRLHTIVEANQQAQLVGGHYGVPLMVYEGEPFFGQDRFDQLKWRLLQSGMRPRDN